MSPSNFQLTRLQRMPTETGLEDGFDGALDDQLPKYSLVDLLDLVESERQKATQKHKLSGLLERMSKFFFTLNRFSKCLDVVTQASSITLVLWGSLRFLVQLFLNHIEVLEKLVRVFENIEEYLGRFGLYQSLFSASLRMQQSLGLIYADIINFSNETLKFYKTRGTFAVLSSSWDRKIAELSDRIKVHKELVEDDAKALAIERQATAHNEARMEHIQNRKRCVRRWLSPPPPHEPDYYTIDHLQALSKRVEGTCDWVCQSDEFRRWCVSAIPILWIRGRPGSGKTIISSVIVEELRRVEAPANGWTVAYFHFKHDNKDKKTPLALVKSLLLQLLSDSEDLLPLLSEIYDQSVYDNASASNLFLPLWNILRRAIFQRTGTYIVLDAIDECEDFTTLLTALLGMFEGQPTEAEEIAARIVLISRPDRLTTSIRSPIKCPSLRIRDGVLQITGISHSTGQIILQEVRMDGQATCRERPIAAIPMYLHKYNSVSAMLVGDTTRHDDNDRVGVLIGYWPFANNWPFPGIDDRPLPQPVYLHAICRNEWSPTEGRVLEQTTSHPATLSQLLVYCHPHRDPAILPPRYLIPADMVATQERLQFVRAIVSGDDKYTELISTLGLDRHSTGFSDAGGFNALDDAPEQCQVRHEFPWSVFWLETEKEEFVDGGGGSNCGGDDGKEEKLRPYTNGVASGWHWETMRSRTRRVLEADGQPAPLWRIWWRL
ncbi:MAG: hypothetical protein M1817_002735 [Caeruleum heppii]|nr:MAG: hypothetical protein M1817_002735 [Caeruleum heppii]